MIVTSIVLADLFVNSGVKEPLDCHDVSINVYGGLDVCVAEILKYAVRRVTRTIGRLYSRGTSM